MTTRARDHHIDVTEALAGDLTSVLDFLSRVVKAGDQGNLPYMHEKAAQLMHAARALLARISEHPLPTNVNRPVRYAEDNRFDPERLRALIARGAHHYLAGRLLYPKVGSPYGSPEQRALTAAAADLVEAGHSETGLTVEQATSVANWLRARRV